MIRTIIPASLALALVAPDALAGEWAIDTTHSEVGFVVRHMMVTNVRGRFKTYSGTVQLDDKNPAKSKIDVAIDTATIDTDVEDRDKHLRSADFFNTEKFPKMTFQSTKITKKGRGYVVQGKLTIRGVTKPVTLQVTELTKPIEDPWGKTRRGATATAEIKRKDFGLTWNKPLEAGGVVVGDRVQIQIQLALVQG